MKNIFNEPVKIAKRRRITHAPTRAGIHPHTHTRIPAGTYTHAFALTLDKIPVKCSSLTNSKV